MLGGGALMRLIAEAPWREAVTYRESWPHECVVIKRDGQQALLAAFCARIEAGEGVKCWFFHQMRRFLFLPVAPPLELGLAHSRQPTSHWVETP